MLRWPFAYFLLLCGQFLCACVLFGCSSPPSSGHSGSLAFDEGGAESSLSDASLVEDALPGEGEDGGTNALLTACEQNTATMTGTLLCEDWGDTCVVSSVGPGNCELLCNGMGLECLEAQGESAPCIAVETSSPSCVDDIPPGD